ncbi:hypothetical protein GOP47_0001588 [Adiantum capillus-veneris]|uniref:Cyanobacterial aminoacyl-tRNA synthetase CAAD domain-containing protein n=1 Tax=Adiantum capillus-veneris TaxID=13818 RepID=A0A9D4V9B3_ADICA|nr:hypothetical protein GOP47_0001588 [Adiantum capillus-veneris]
MLTKTDLYCDLFYSKFPNSSYRVLQTALPLSDSCYLAASVSRLTPSSTSAASSSLQHARFLFNPSLHRLSGSRRGVWVVSRAAEEPFDANKVLNDTLKDLQEAWEKTEEKLALGTLGFSVLITVWASVGVVSAIDRLPLLPSFLELVGVFYSAWFAYRYLLFKPDREELRKKADDILNSIIGTSDISDTY